MIWWGSSARFFDRKKTNVLYILLKCSLRKTGISLGNVWKNKYKSFIFCNRNTNNTTNLKIPFIWDKIIRKTRNKRIWICTAKGRNQNVSNRHRTYASKRYEIRIEMLAKTDTDSFWYLILFLLPALNKCKNPQMRYILKMRGFSITSLMNKEEHGVSSCCSFDPISCFSVRLQHTSPN